MKPIYIKNEKSKGIIVKLLIDLIIKLTNLNYFFDYDDLNNLVY